MFPKQCLLLSLFLSLALPNLFSQQSVIDSLRTELKQATQKDSQYVKDWIDLGQQLVGHKPAELHRLGEDMVRLSEEINFPQGVWSGKGFSGVYYAIRGEFDEALKYFQESLQVAKANKRQRYVALMLNNIGGIYFSRKEYAKAQKYVLACSKINENLGSTESMGTNLLSLGQLYYNWYSENPDSLVANPTLLDTSIMHYTKALEVFTTAKSDKRIGQATIGIGLTYAKQGKYQKALAYCEKALQIGIDIGDQSSIAFDKGHIGGVLLDMGQAAAAEPYIKEALAMAREINIKQLEMSTLENLLEAYRGQKKYKEALVTKEELTALEKVVFDENAEKRLGELEVQYETREKEKANQLLSDQNRLLAQQNKLWLAVAGGFFILLLFSFLFYERLQKKNQTINEQKQMLEQLNSTKDQFFGIIAHDLRGPMLSFRNLSEKIRYLIDSRQTERIDALGQSVDEAYSKLERLLDNLLQWALVQRGTLPFEPQNITLEETVQEVFDLFSEMAQTKQVYLESRVEKGLYLYADANALAAILRNLINNALKYSMPGARVSIATQNRAKTFQIIIVDEGMGFSPIELENLFQLEAQRKTPVGNKERGTGLGLQLCKELMELHKGQIRVDSQLDKGTQIYLTFPYRAKKEVMPLGKPR